ncbi:ribonuclease H-like domain-containing protein [Tanacetum coccineum]
MPYESPLQSVHSLGRDEGSLLLHELMVLCTNLSNKVTSLEVELAQTKQTYGIALTKLIKKVKKIEQTVKTSQSRRRTRVVLFEEEEISEDPSKQGRSLIEEIDLDADISLRKDKGKAIMIEDESIQKKSKKQLKQERLSHEEAIRLQEQIDKEERKRIARDTEIAKQFQEEYDKAGKKEAVAEVDTDHVIDWNNPSVIRYHALQHRPRSVVEVRKNMIMYLKNQGGSMIKDFKRMSYDDIRPIFEKV